MTKARIQLGAIVVLVVIASALLLAQKANPDAPPLFNIKRIQEKVFLKLKSTPQDRVDYMSSMLDSRLEELQNIVKAQNYGYVLNSALRYSTLAGQITDLVVANHLIDKVESLKNQFLSHRKALDDLYNIYPKNIDSWEWKYIQDDYNYLKLYLDKLDKVK